MKTKSIEARDEGDERELIIHLVPTDDKRLRAFGPRNVQYLKVVTRRGRNNENEENENEDAL